MIEYTRLVVCRTRTQSLVRGRNCQKKLLLKVHLDTGIVTEEYSH